MAEELERDAEVAADGGEGAGSESGSGSGSGSGSVDALELLDALHAQTGESRDVILRWAWKRFCAEWARLYPSAARERARVERQRQDEAFRELEQASRSRGA